MNKILHYISKYSLIFLIYCLLLALSFHFISSSYTTIILVTLIYIILIKNKILVFTSSWIKEANN